MIKLDTSATFYVVDSIQNQETGKRYKAITSQVTELVSIEEVGSETFYQSYANNIRLTRTIQMRKMSYNNQTYVKLKGDSNVYQVTRVAKGVTIQYIKLPLEICTDKEVVAIINA